MSENPFSDEFNPYNVPQNTNAPTQFIQPPSNPLVAPATVLLVISILWLLLVLASIPGQVMNLKNIDTSTPEGFGELCGNLVGLVIWIATGLAMVLGFVSMIRLRSYRSAMAAAILSVIPCCSPCLFLGIPFGIWAIILLVRPEVKESFTP